MKACVLEAVGRLVYRDVPMPVIQEDEVLLKIKACGICSSDIDRVFRTGTYHYPTIPGHEFSGEIVQTGSSVDSSLLGKHAVVFPIKPCFSCPACRRKAYAKCDRYSYYGSRENGAFAEYLAVKAWNIVCYEGIPDEQAAMCEPAAVALHAVEQAGLKAGGTAAIVGTGTIGCLAAMWSAVLKAKQVIIIGRNDRKIKYIQDMRLPETVILNQNADDFQEKLQSAAGKEGPDVVIECVGSSGAVGKAISIARKEGTIVLVGNPSGEMRLQREIYWKILRKELQVKGSWNSDYSEEDNDWKKVLQAMQEKKIDVSRLITHIYSLEKYQEAFQTVMDSNTVSMKVMLKNDN